MHNGPMRTKTSPPSIRLTIPVDAETHATFQRLADAGREPIGRCMGRWLGDTVSAAEIAASAMERARSSPKVVAEELHSMMLGMVEQTKFMRDKYHDMKGPLDGKGAPLVGKGSRPAAPSTPIPPPCNTGGKVLSGKQHSPKSATTNNGVTGVLSSGLVSVSTTHTPLKKASKVPK